MSVLLQWQSWELWGCHRYKSWRGIHGMGLVLLLGGRQMIAMTSTKAVILAATSHRQTYRHRPCDPLYPGERALIWELGN